MAATLAAAALTFLASVTDAAGHRTRIAEATGRTRRFSYDDLNRLTSEQVLGDPAGENGTVAYAHDLVGNRGRCCFFGQTTLQEMFEIS